MRGRSLSTPSKGCRVVDYYTRRDSTAVFHLHMWSYTCTQSSIENYYIVNPDTCDIYSCNSLSTVLCIEICTEYIAQQTALLQLQAVSSLLI